MAGTELTILVAVARGLDQLPVAVRPAARARLPRPADGHRGRGLRGRRPPSRWTRRPARARLRRGFRGRLHAPRDHRDVRWPARSPTTSRRCASSAALILIVLGLALAGILPIPALERTWRPLDAGARRFARDRDGLRRPGDAGSGRDRASAIASGSRLVSSSGGWLASFGLGAIFAIGWTPCIGIILGGILTMAATSGHGRPGRDPADRLHARARPAVHRDRRRLRPGAAAHGAARPPRADGVADRRAARRLHRRRDGLRLAQPAAALLQLQRRLMAERPEFTHKQRAPRARSGRSAAGSSVFAFVAVVMAGIVLVGVTTPLGTTGDGPAPVDPRATAYIIDVAAAGRAQAGRPRPNSASTLDDGTTYQLTDLDGTPDPARRPARQGRLAQLLRDVVPAVPVRDADPARPLRARYKDRGLELVAISVQETSPADVQAYADKYQLAYTIGFDGSGRDLPRVQGLRPADPVLHRPERRHPVDRRGAARRGRRRSSPRAPASNAILPPPERAAGVEREPEPVRPRPDRLEAEAVAVAHQAADRVLAPRATGRRSSPRRRPGRTARPCGRPSRAGSRRTRDPARVRRPRAHQQVPEEGQGPCRRRRCPARRPPGGRSSGRRSGRRVTPGMISRSPSAQPCSPHPRRASAPAGRTTRRAAGCRPARPPTRRVWATIFACGNARSPSARSRPPAWSKWRWLIATTSTDSGRNPAVSSAATIHGPS